MSRCVACARLVQPNRKNGRTSADGRGSSPQSSTLDRAPDSEQNGNQGTHEPDSLGNSEYAQKRRELLALLRSLNKLGADGVLEIPRIVVIGKQSAGKSSLVEGVTWIKVPRDAGTCTRCPLECNISTDTQQWSCTVSLRRDGLMGEEPFSPELRDKNDVELWIRRAQAAVLCPHLPADMFKSKGPSDIRTLTDTGNDPKVQSFTKSKVVINIYDPDGTDLSFVDLPGLIENDRTDVIKLVDDLTLDYISPPSTIILVTAPADDEMENQKAMRFAREKDPEGERTICVITKADMVDSGSSSKRKLWKEIFEGGSEKHRLKLGYYAARLPKDDERERGITAQELQLNATHVFNVVAPWSDLGGQHRDRLGVHALVRDLSELLMELLDKALPRMLEKVNKLLKSCQRDLGDLPQLLSDGPGEVIQRISKFSTDIQAVVYGRSEDKSFVHLSRDAYRSLRWAIRRTAPDFRPFKDPNDYIAPPEPDCQVKDDERADLMDRKYAIDIDDMEARRGKALAKDETDVISVSDVRDVIKRCTGWEILPYVPYDANVQLIKMFVKKWSDPAHRCFDQVHELIEDVLAEKIPEHFGTFPILKKDITLMLQDYLEEHVGLTMSKLDEVLKREEPPYWTQNAHDLGTTQEQWLKHYQLVMRRRAGYEIEEGLQPCIESSAPESSPRADLPRYPYVTAERDWVAEAVEALRHIPTYRDVVAADLPRLLHLVEHQEASDCDEELQVMAGVRSYFQVAYKRITDVVPNTLQRDLVEGFANSLQAHLLEKLAIGSADASQRLQQLLAEDPDIAAKRKRLQGERRKLEEIKRQLQNFSV